MSIGKSSGGYFSMLFHSLNWDYWCELDTLFADIPDLTNEPWGPKTWS
ncbi:MAG: hypothetical protein ACLRX5_10265 [Slackia sp.]